VRPFPPNEAKRLEALRRYQVLDTAPEPAFDDFVELAAAICGTPISTVTFIDEDRQWFKARLGLTGTESPREHSFCAHTILQDQLMVVEDAAADERFAANPLVTGDPHIRFYAGAPLMDREGHGLGSLCVIDREPHHITDAQRSALRTLARRVMAELEYRLISAQLAAALSEVKLLEGLLPICGHCKKIRDDAGTWTSLEGYVHSHTEARFSHGICPGCVQEHHPQVYAALKAAGKL
jgi:GAF domain-containing protein